MMSGLQALMSQFQLVARKASQCREISSARMQQAFPGFFQSPDLKTRRIRCRIYRHQRLKRWRYIDVKIWFQKCRRGRERHREAVCQTRLPKNLFRNCCIRVPVAPIELAGRSNTCTRKWIIQAVDASLKRLGWASCVEALALQPGPDDEKLVDSLSRPGTPRHRASPIPNTRYRGSTYRLKCRQPFSIAAE
jgi:hypothetical protein